MFLEYGKILSNLINKLGGYGITLFFVLQN